MKLEDLVDFWRDQQSCHNGLWAHSADRDLLSNARHSFNLQFPVAPYVGDVLNAPIIILGANGGFDDALTPAEFPDFRAIENYINRLNNPSKSDWSFVSKYYDKTNYGSLIACGKAVLVNACSYRSTKLSQEPANKILIKKLPTCLFVREWLLRAVLPMARQEKRLVVIKRGGQWRLPEAATNSLGVVKDPAPVSPLITNVPFGRIISFLKNG